MENNFIKNVEWRFRINLSLKLDESIIETRMFPEPGKNDVISCHALTPDFLVLGTDMGAISYFILEDWVTVQACTD